MTYKAVARPVKLVGSLIWHIGTVVRTKVRRLQGKPIPGSLVVLCYHAVPQNQRERFGRQMDLLRQYAKPTRADVEPPLLAGERYAAVTFDDGYQSTVENALPELKARNIPCTLFVVSHLPGHSPWWSGTEGYDREDKFVTAEQLVNLPSELVTIGSHTMTHPNLSALSEEMAKRELFDSRQLLQQTLRREIRLFAFPHGAFNDALVTWCREAGYQRVFSIEPTMTFSNSPEYVTGRVIADPTDSDLEFRLKISGAYQWLPVAYRIKRKVRAMLKTL
jgi:peptidoglycan/xylan/chitin deacetylase (PgdA/CDA1 family)